MTDRVRTLTVILDRDYRDEDVSVGVIKQAIQMIKGVASVESGEVTDHNSIVARLDYQIRFAAIISDLLREPDGDFMIEVQGAHEKLKKRRGY